MRILLAEDNQSLARATSALLRHERNGGHSVEIVYDGVSASEKIANRNYDIIILDIMMPYKSGLEVLEELRDCGNTTPVILLTAKTEISDKVIGLDYGADDYLTKPYDTSELISRIYAVVRSRKMCNTQIAFVDVMLDRKHMNLVLGAAAIPISSEETAIAEMLAVSSGVAFIDDISEKIGCDANTIDLYVAYLNKKLNGLGSKYYMDITDDRVIVRDPMK